jgi:hypothetical protein
LTDIGETDISRVMANIPPRLSHVQVLGVADPDRGQLVLSECSRAVQHFHAGELSLPESLGVCQQRLLSLENFDSVSFRLVHPRRSLLAPFPRPFLVVDVAEGSWRHVKAFAGVEGTQPVARLSATVYNGVVPGTLLLALDGERRPAPAATDPANRFSLQVSSVPRIGDLNIGTAQSTTLPTGPTSGHVTRVSSSTIAVLRQLSSFGSRDTVKDAHLPAPSPIRHSAHQAVASVLPPVRTTIHPYRFAAGLGVAIREPIPLSPPGTTPQPFSPPEFIANLLSPFSEQTCPVTLTHSTTAGVQMPELPGFDAKVAATAALGFDSAVLTPRRHPRACRVIADAAAEVALTAVTGKVSANASPFALAPLARAEASVSASRPLIRGLHGRIALVGGLAAATNGGPSPFDRFFLGGLTLRGFTAGAVGPRDVADHHIGTKAYATASAELLCPLRVPFQKPNARGNGLFATLFGAASVLDDGPRASAGAGFVFCAADEPCSGSRAFELTAQKVWAKPGDRFRQVQYGFGLSLD